MTRERLGSRDSLLGFSFEGGLSRLLSEGQSMYTLGPGCDTCGFLFERVGAPRQDAIPTRILADRLRSGLNTIDRDVVKAFSALLPAGDYLVALLQIEPTLVMPGDPNDYFAKESVPLFGLDQPFYDLPMNPRTPYYRLGSTVLQPEGERYGFDSGQEYQRRAQTFGFLAPMESICALDSAMVAAYQTELEVGVPTAVSISLIEARSPAVTAPGAQDPRPDGIHAHWCWVHFLLDGHHKVRAASLSTRPLTLLSFTAVSEGRASAGQISQLVKTLT